MGIVIGSCMAKETSAANINSPVYPSERHIGINPSDGRNPLAILMGGGVSYVSAEQQQRLSRAVSGPVPYAYIHDNSHQLRGQPIQRRVVHGGFMFTFLFLEQVRPRMIIEFMVEWWRKLLVTFFLGMRFCRSHP